MSNFLLAAQYYMKKGFSVIPLLPKDKKPAFSWKEYQNRKATLEELSTWFGSNQHNIGIVTGEISHLSVLDCDNEKAIKLAEMKGVGQGPRVKTGHGMHFYFSYANGLRNFQKRDDLPGIDVRGDGGYVVAPPSIHPSGVAYQWLNNKNKLDEFPSWVVSQQPNTKKQKLYEPAKKGTRNMSLARLAGILLKQVSFEEALELLLVWNLRNDPPLPESEVRQTIASIQQAEMRNHPDESQDILQYVGKIKEMEGKIIELHAHGLENGEALGWRNLDRLYRPRRGEWTLVTGIPGHGKSEFLDNMILRLALKGWKFAVFSAEKLPTECHVASLVEKYSGQPFEGDSVYRIKTSDLKITLATLDNKIKFIEPPEDHCTLEAILKIARAIKEDSGLDGLIIDPWGEIESQIPQNVTETNYIASCLIKIRRFARQHRVHVWLVAHPAKMKKNDKGKYDIPTPYDVSGSAHWRNKADMAISVWRDTDNESEPTQVHVQKVRFKKTGQIGFAKLKYDVETGRFEDI